MRDHSNRKGRGFGVELELTQAGRRLGRTRPVGRCGDLICTPDGAMSTLLDQLARTAAQPISRSHALKLIGGALLSGGALRSAPRGRPGEFAPSPVPPARRLRASSARSRGESAASESVARQSSPFAAPPATRCAAATRDSGAARRRSGTSREPNAWAARPVRRNVAGFAVPRARSARMRTSSTAAAPGSTCAQAAAPSTAVTATRPAVTASAARPGCAATRGAAGTVRRRRGSAETAAAARRARRAATGAAVARSRSAATTTTAVTRTRSAAARSAAAGTRSAAATTAAPTTGSVAGAGAAPSGRTCARHQQTGRKTCCAQAHLIRSPAGLVCCSDTDVAVGNRCCPRTNPRCNECDPPCRAGESCRSGYCLPI